MGTFTIDPLNVSCPITNVDNVDDQDLTALLSMKESIGLRSVLPGKIKQNLEKDYERHDAFLTGVYLYPQSIDAAHRIWHLYLRHYKQ